MDTHGEAYKCGRLWPQPDWWNLPPEAQRWDPEDPNHPRYHDPNHPRWINRDDARHPRHWLTGMRFGEADYYPASNVPSRV